MLIDGRVPFYLPGSIYLDKDIIDTHPYIVALQGYIAMLMGDKTLGTYFVQPGHSSNGYQLKKPNIVPVHWQCERISIGYLGNLDAAIEDANESIKIISIIT